MVLLASITLCKRSTNKVDRRSEGQMRQRESGGRGHSSKESAANYSTFIIKIGASSPV